MSYCNIGKKENREKILTKYGNKCAYCGCNITLETLHVDHIKPARRHMSTGNGPNTLENYNPACNVCNVSKGSLDLETWRIELAMKVERLNKYHSLYRIVKSFGLVEETNKPVTFYFERYG